MQECSGVPNLQTELNYLDSFKSYCIFTDFMVPTSPWSPHCPHGLNVVPMMFSHVPIILIVTTWFPHPHGCCLHGLHSMVFPHYPHHSYIIPTSSRRSPHHPQSPRYPLYPPSPPRGGPRISKNSIQFELIDILWRLPHLWVGTWVGGCMGGLMGDARSNH